MTFRISDFLTLLKECFVCVVYDNHDDVVQSHRCLMPIPACIWQKAGKEEKQIGTYRYSYPL